MDDLYQALLKRKMQGNLDNMDTPEAIDTRLNKEAGARQIQKFQDSGALAADKAVADNPFAQLMGIMQLSPEQQEKLKDPEMARMVDNNNMAMGMAGGAMGSINKVGKAAQVAEEATAGLLPKLKKMFQVGDVQFPAMSEKDAKTVRAALEKTGRVGPNRSVVQLNPGEEFAAKTLAPKVKTAEEAITHANPEQLDKTLISDIPDTVIKASGAKNEKIIDKKVNDFVKDQMAEESRKITPEELKSAIEEIPGINSVINSPLRGSTIPIDAFEKLQYSRLRNLLK